MTYRTAPLDGEFRRDPKTNCFCARCQSAWEATIIGERAAKEAPDDGGSANLDHVVLYGLKGVREASMRTAGIRCHKGKPGEFHLSVSFAGQGNRRYFGVQAMHKFLKEHGVNCYIFYQLD